MKVGSRHLELLFYKTYSDLRAEAERTYVGFLWWIIDPVINMAVFWVVFSFVLDRGTDDYVAFLLVGIVVWRWIGSTLSQGGLSIPANAALAQQVYIPKVIFPLVVVLDNVAKFAIAFGVLLLFLWVYGLAPDIHYLALPVVLLVQLALIVGATLLLAGLIPFMPDLHLIVENFVLRLAFFLSGIFFPASAIPESVRPWFYLNPMLPLIESYRDVLMYRRWPDFEALATIAIASVILCALGWSIIARNDLVYAKNLA